MNFFDYIRDWFIWATQSLVYAAMEAYGWPLVGNWLGDAFRDLSTFTARVAGYLYDASNWYNLVTGRIAQILSQADILSLLRTWLSYAENAWNWVVSAGQNVTAIINTWWSLTSQAVMVWVQDAKNLATTLFNQANAALAPLQAAWDGFKSRIPAIDAVLSWWGNWWANVLSNLNTWWNSRLTDVNGLINSAFVTREQLWAGWQDFRGKVAEFFTDPVEYVWARFTDWFLGSGG